MSILAEQPLLYFSLYPPIGDCDWRYTFATAQVRALEDRMLTPQLLTELANTKDITELAEMLAGTEYAVSPQAIDLDMEQMLRQRRTEIRRFFEQLITDDKIIQLFRARIDFANIRLAVRRLVLKKPLGSDYCQEGNVSKDAFEQVFEQENYSGLPKYFQQGVEAGVVGYYKNKNVRDIDLEIDRVEADSLLELAADTGSIFLAELFRMQIDLTNIRTMMRMKFTGLPSTDAFLTGGYIEKSKLIQCLDIGYEALAQHFYATPYYHLIEIGANYLQKENSFLKLEAVCDEHLLGFLKTTRYIAAGTQPIIAYLLAKEHEIRMVRTVLACKKAEIEPKVILDRIVV
jgi:V/A-type H+-transporting ATPase subunit C